MKVIDSEGKLFDLDKGDFVRDESGKIVTPEPPTYRSEEVPKLDEDFDAFRTFYLQPTWALNSALFALPDTAVSAVGRAFGVKDDFLLPNFLILDKMLQKIDQRDMLQQ